jgi:hypothetical protein
MRWIALISMLCLIGGAAAQEGFTDAAYTTTQNSFLHGPDTAPFEPYVERYWSSYIQNSQNLTVMKSPAQSMTIWYNNFPLGFQQPVKLSNSSFLTSGQGKSKYSQAEWDSMLLKRTTMLNFNIDESWKFASVFSPSKAQQTSFSLASGENQSSMASSGRILSQSIASFFSR